jgi:hypothetical protein
MRANTSAVQKLPRGRTGRRVQWLSDRSALQVGIFGLFLYAGIVIAFSVVEIIGRWLDHDWVDGASNWADIVYFNFITILTIGYGDLKPVGLGRILAILEAILGTGVVGVTLAALTAKFISPPTNAIVFSRYAYYCIDQQRFMVIYLNTTHNVLVNAESSSYFKLDGDWRVNPPVRSPFVTQSVQTFLVDPVPEGELVSRLRKSDALRFGIAGGIGMTSVSAAVEYRPDEIIVLPSREPLNKVKEFYTVDLASKRLAELFHYRPEGAPTLLEYALAERGAA